ncbi:hypothetical protein ACFL0V_01430 [Nanoarchaeota archaeon]
MRTIRPDKRHVLSTREAMTEVGTVSVDSADIIHEDYEIMVDLEGPVRMLWSKELLEGGAEHTQKEWHKRMQDEKWRKEHGDYQIATTIVYAATLEALRGGGNPKLYAELKGDLDRGILTGTYIKYKPGQDVQKIIHHDREDGLIVKHDAGILGSSIELEPDLAAKLFDDKNIHELFTDFGRNLKVKRPESIKKRNDSPVVLLREEYYIQFTLGRCVVIGMGDYDQTPMPVRGVRYENDQTR